MGLVKKFIMTKELNMKRTVKKIVTPKPACVDQLAGLLDCYKVGAATLYAPLQHSDEVQAVTQPCAAALMGVHSLPRVQRTTSGDLDTSCQRYRAALEDCVRNRVSRAAQVTEDRCKGSAQQRASARTGLRRTLPVRATAQVRLPVFLCLQKPDDTAAVKAKYHKELAVRASTRHRHRTAAIISVSGFQALHPPCTDSPFQYRALLSHVLRACAYSLALCMQRFDEASRRHGFSKV